MDTHYTPEQLHFHAHGRREGVARFDGGRITSDAGGVLLRETDLRLGLMERLARCFRDCRNPGSVEHSVRSLVAQRVYALALGYEDLNDHEDLRRDRLLALLVGKAQYLPRGANPRFVVTSLRPRRADARCLYEELYCARGEENPIKEQQLGLFADRISSTTLRANQLRLYFASFAYVLMHGLRRLALAGTTCAKAQCATIRLKLLKIRCPRAGNNSKNAFWRTCYRVAPCLCRVTSSI